MNYNKILMTDSYKGSHYLQYPQGTEYVNSYIESRGGRWNRTLFFGLQIFLQEYLSKPISLKDIHAAKHFWEQHGLPFNLAGWTYILSEHKGYLPVRIEALPEGTVLPTGNVLVQVRNTDPKCYWLTSYLETALLRAVWYPTTVATNSYMCKQHIKDALVKSGDPEQLLFKLHDFGARGTSSAESAGIGGCAHLVNFMGSDTVEGVICARQYYGEEMAGFSIPAAEHSTITAWGGKDGEIEAFRNMLTQFGGKYPLIAVVSDSYDIYNAVSNIWGGILEKEVTGSGSTLIVRPDSGNPVAVVCAVIQRLMDKFGCTTNEKGYRVLPPYIRVIQGDGVDERAIKDILFEMMNQGLSADNVAFGMGGALLQHFDRDTFKFAMKCSAIRVNGTWRDVYKDPVTDPGKRSKRGRLSLTCKDGRWNTTSEVVPPEENQLRVVFENGKVLNPTTLAEVRDRSNKLCQ